MTGKDRRGARRVRSEKTAGCAARRIGKDRRGAQRVGSEKTAGARSA